MTIALDDDLFTLTIRLTEEYPEIPAGSVMRCVARVRCGMPGWPECRSRSSPPRRSGRPG
jgi:hypothetical protein